MNNGSRQEIRRDEEDQGENKYLMNSCIKSTDHDGSAPHHVPLPRERRERAEGRGRDARAGDWHRESVIRAHARIGDGPLRPLTARGEEELTMMMMMMMEQRRSSGKKKSHKHSKRVG